MHVKEALLGGLCRATCKSSTRGQAYTLRILAVSEDISPPNTALRNTPNIHTCTHTHMHVHTHTHIYTHNFTYRRPWQQQGWW